MKKKTKTINAVIIAACALFLGTLVAYAGQPRPRTHKPIKVNRADVKAVITKVDVTKTEPDSEGVTCYTIRPHFRVQNIGTGTAKNFRVTLKGAVFPDKKGFTWVSSPITLAPGNAQNWGPDETREVDCCIDKFKKEHKTVIIVVLADSANNLWEYDEGNNRDRRQIDLHWNH